MNERRLPRALYRSINESSETDDAVQLFYYDIEAKGGNPNKHGLISIGGIVTRYNTVTKRLDSREEGIVLLFFYPVKGKEIDHEYYDSYMEDNRMDFDVFDPEIDPCDVDPEDHITSPHDGLRSLHLELREFDNGEEGEGGKFYLCGPAGTEKRNNAFLKQWCKDLNSRAFDTLFHSTSIKLSSSVEQKLHNMLRSEAMDGYYSEYYN